MHLVGTAANSAMDLRNWLHFFKVLVSGYFLVYVLDSVFPSHVNPLAMICVTCVRQ